MSALALIPQGASFSRTYTSVQDETGAIVTTFAGWTFAGAIKASIEDADGAAVIAIADGAFSRSGGSVGFTLAPTTMAALSVGQIYRFAVKARSPSGFVDTIDELRLQITQTARQSI
jgi:hypothetical protein